MPAWKSHRHSVIYGAETCPIKKVQERKLEVAEMSSFWNGKMELRSDHAQWTE